MTFGRLAIMFASIASVVALAQSPQDPDWKALEAETMQHYQAVLRLDTRNPPGNEQHRRRIRQAACSTRKAFRRRSSARIPSARNLVARLKGNGKKRPLLIMGHSDTVTTDEKKWTYPPFSATRDGGYVYGRGTVDDKDNLTGGADDDAAAEAAERAARSRRDLPLGGRRGRQLGRRHRLTWCSDHFPQIEAEYCLAEGGGVDAHRRPGEVRHGADAREDSARHRAGGARHLRPRIDSAQVERDRPSRRRGREGRRLAAGRSGSTRRPAPTSASSRRSRRPRSRSTTATCCRPIRRCSAPPTTGCSRTSRGIRRCCARRCRRTSSPAATART